MSEYRERMIREGKIVPATVEHVAKQLFNVAKHEEDGQDSVPAENVTWAAADSDVRAVFMAMARYVVSTYTENDRLRQKVHQLEAESKNRVA